MRIKLDQHPTELLVKMGLSWITVANEKPLILPHEDAPTERPVTWRSLIAAEPRLNALYHLACAVYDDKENSECFCPNYVYVHTLKPILVNLVGWRVRAHPILGTSIAYDVALKKIYNVLPGCRNCGCIGF